MKRTYLWILLIPIMLLAAGCHKKQVQKKPDNLISRNTMVNIIAECYIIEGIVSFNPADTVDRFESTKAYYKDLFDRYHVTREQFNTSVQYYMGDEDQADKILSEASSLVSKKKKEFAAADTATTADPAAVDIVYE